MPENFFGLGAPQHPDAASRKPVKRRKGKKRSRKNKKHTNTSLLVQRGPTAFRR